MKKKFFNIVASGDTATIWLYGDIGDGRYETVSSGDISRELKEAEAVYKTIEIRINSLGGEVYAGIAIFNAIRNSKANIKIFVDGIAASMASVIALCGKPVEMSRYARLMLHSVSGGCWGRVQELKQAIVEMDSLENTLCEMIAQKTGGTAEDIKASYFDGTDHYLTAQEALDLGFIDGVYDADPVPEDSTPEQVYNIFNNRPKRPQNNNQMNIEELRKRPLFKDAATDADVLRIIDQTEKEAARAQGLAADVTRLNAELKVFQDKEKAQENVAKKALLDAAEADGRINAQTRPTYQALLDNDFENAKAAIEALPKKKRAVDAVDQVGGDDAGAWSKKQEQIKNKK
jgi:ATP-dependent Clp endopeptidase proteolytic subunit ClpP